MTGVKNAKRCFVISPIGAEGSDVRKHADEVFEYLIHPAMKECGIEPLRSDHLDKPGRISEQMFRAILDYDLCVAVLTGHNPNVFYELAVAQAAKRPVVLLIEKRESLPFDIKDLRCISYDLDIRSFQERTHIARLVKFIEDIEAANWKAPDIFAPFSKVSAAQAAVNSFCDRVKGEWWERITGDGIGFFQIQMDELHNSVQLVEGHFYNEKGDLTAHWNSAAVRIEEENSRKGIVYLRECKVLARDPKNWFHGYGDMWFEGPNQSFSEGHGTFYDVNRDDPQKTLAKSVDLRRVHDTNEISTIQNGPETDRKSLVLKMKDAW